MVHNFDFLFDKGDDTAIHIEIFWPEEIDGITHECGYEQRDDGYWYFNVECFNTKLTLAVKILKQDKIVLKSEMDERIAELEARIAALEAK